MILERDFEILGCLKRTKSLLDSKILWSKKDEIFRFSIYLEILVHMHFLIKQADTVLGKRLIFNEDIKLNDKIKDITDLMITFRNAACHNDSMLRYHGDKLHPFGQKSYFGSVHGKGRYADDPQVESMYEDDVAFVVGTEILYLKRHIERAFEELLVIFRPFFPNEIPRIF